MKQEDYQCSFTAAIGPEEAIEHISDVSAWWAKKLEGCTRLLHDVFTVHFGDTFVSFEITGLVPGRKLEWLVTDCYLHWINDKQEWTGTRIVWEAEAAGDRTRIHMRHEGLVPSAECFADCRQGWDHHIKDSLLKYMEEEVGIPE
jgi:hypothetical protein